MHTHHTAPHRTAPLRATPRHSAPLRAAPQAIVYSFEVGKNDRGEIRIYVGSCVRKAFGKGTTKQNMIAARGHNSALKRGTHHNRHVQNAVKQVREQKRDPEWLPKHKVDVFASKGGETRKCFYRRVLAEEQAAIDSHRKGRCFALLNIMMTAGHFGPDDWEEAAASALSDAEREQLLLARRTHADAVVKTLLARGMANLDTLGGVFALCLSPSLPPSCILKKPTYCQS